MGGAVPPLPQYGFMAWCSAGGSTGTTFTLPLTCAIREKRLRVFQNKVLRRIFGRKREKATRG
jgi:hypothetical protein